MDSDEKRSNMDHLHAALHQVLEDKEKNEREIEEGEVGREQEESRLLSRLLSQVLSEKDAHSTCSTNCSNGVRSREAKEMGIEDIARELRSVKRQNLITHCLLTVMIIVTAAWQISEVSLLLTAKDKLSNPFKAVGDILRNSMKGRGKKAEIDGAPLLPLGVPQVPPMDLLLIGDDGDT